MTEALFDAEPYAYRESMVCWNGDPTSEDYPYGDDHPTNQPCDWGFMCNFEGCLTRVDEQPCPNHAPGAVPGLRLVECTAQPPHILFAHDREDYGHDCPACWARRLYADLRPLQEAAERRAHRWCWALNRLKRLARRVGIARISAYTGSSVCWHVDARWRWTR